MVKKEEEGMDVTITYGTNDNYSIETKTIVHEHAHTVSSKQIRTCTTATVASTLSIFLLAMFRAISHQSLSERVYK